MPNLPFVVAGLNRGPQPPAGEQAAGLLLRDPDLNPCFNHDHTCSPNVSEPVRSTPVRQQHATETCAAGSLRTAPATPETPCALEAGGGPSSSGQTPRTHGPPPSAGHTTRSPPRKQRAGGLIVRQLWTFFAPTPGVHDYYLLYRDKSEGGELGTWHLVQPTQSRRWTSCLWNPDKIQNKVLSDLVQILAGYHDPPKDHGPAVMLTLPYLICLTMAIHAAPFSHGAFRQFVLARKRGLVTTDELLPVLISDFHPI
jgi:hypothetical protein